MDFCLAKENVMTHTEDGGQKTKREGWHRITIDVPPQLHSRIVVLEELVGKISRAELVRDSLRLYEFLAKRTLQDGYEVILSKDGQSEKLALFI
jgi:hypothetical protein